jgi:hypothetical protein
MKRLASIALAFVLINLLAGCGKSSRATAPSPAPRGSSISRDEALPVAQQSADLVSSYVEQAKSLITVARIPGSKPAAQRPLRGLAGAADTSSWTYSLQGFDASGTPIDYVTQNDQLASMTMDWSWLYRTSGDSLVTEYDMRSHSRIDGFLPAATRFVANATDTMRVAVDEYLGSDHLVAVYDGAWQFINLSWEKSGVPTYPVAGTIHIHWHYVYDYTYAGQHTQGDYQVDCAITFNDTRYATITIGSYTFRCDLETGTVS